MKKNKLQNAFESAVEGFKSALKPGTYSAGGEKAICTHFKQNKFDKQEVMQQGGTSLICAGY